jgi:nucleoside-diphosphate-sugar epimerase
MKRTQFVVTGRHPLLPLVIQQLIADGYELVPTFDQVNLAQPAFIVLGAEVYSLQAMFQLLSEVKVAQAFDWPVLLLSSSSVYSDRDVALKLREIVPMDEAQGHLITSPLDETAVRPVAALAAEHALVQRPKGKTIIVRPFNVFGTSCTAGVVHTFVTACKEGKPLPVYTPGRQVRTFLWQEDFQQAVSALTQKLVKGHRGIYNVGSDEQVEILSLAKSIGQVFNKEIQIDLVEAPERHIWWKVPAIDRLRIDAKCKPRTSLRAGLWMAHETEQRNS